MKNAFVLLGALLLTSCSKDQSQEKGGPATVTGGSVATSAARPPTPEEVRTALMEAKPNQPEIVNALVITDEGGVVTMKGTVPDEQSRTDIVNRVKRMPNVSGVHDQIQVAPSQQQQAAAPATGTGKTTPATDAVRAGMKRDRPAAAAVIEHLVITDDGSVISISGTVPDQATRDALMKSAEKSASGRRVTDNMHVGTK